MKETICLGRDEELDAIENIRKNLCAQGRAYSLIVVGSPRIGKTTLIKKAQEDLTEKAKECCVLPIRLSWPQDGSWDVVFHRIDRAIRTVKNYEQTSDLLAKYESAWNSVTEEQDIFDRFQKAGISLIFLIDDIDHALYSTPIQWGDILQWARHPNVCLIVTSSRSLESSIPEFGEGFREIWLHLLTGEDAKYLAQTLVLLEENESSKVVTTMLTWAGYHPFLLETLALYIESPSGITKAIRAWQGDSRVQGYLERVWEGLDLAHHPRARRALYRLVTGAEINEPTRAEISGIRYLRRYGVVTRERPYKIPSRLFRVFAMKQLGLQPPGMWKFVSDRAILGTILGGFLVNLLLMAILYLLGASPAWAMFVLLLPMLYMIYGWLSKRILTREGWYDPR